MPSVSLPLSANVSSSQDGRPDSVESEKEFRNALDIETRIFGPEQAETAETKYDLATLLARKGQIEEPLSLLNQAVGHGLPPLVALKMDKDPFLIPLHSNPRFAELVARIRRK